MLVYGGMVDVMMVNDARYYVEDWLERPENANRSVGMAGFDIYLPRFDGRRTQELIEYWPDVLETAPHFIVTNHGYSCRARPNSDEEEFYARLRDESNGYRLALAYRYRPPWPTIALDDVWWAECPTGLTNLATVNPEIEVFERLERHPRPR